MKLFYKLSLLFILLITASCDQEEFFNKGHQSKGHIHKIDFQYKSSIQVGGETASEISAYNSRTKKLFVVNIESLIVTVK